MNNEKRKHNIEMLINIFNIPKKEVDSMSDDEIEKLVYKKQKEKLNISKNPNKFWFIKGMPMPKHVEPTTSKKWGALVVIALFVVLIGFLGMFIGLAVKNH